MSKHSIPVHVWLLSAFLAVAFVCSAVIASGKVVTWLAILSAACVTGSLTVWLLSLLRYELPLRRMLDSIADKEDSGAVDALGADASGAIWREIRNARSRDKDIVKICYEVAARLCCARQATQAGSREVLGAVEAADKKCKDLRQHFHLLRDGLAHGSITVQPGCGADEISGVPSYQLKSGNPVLKSVFEEVVSSAREMAELLREVDQNAKELMTSTEETAYSMSRLDSFLQDMANSGKELESSTDTANRVALEGTKVVGEMAKENEAITATVKEAASAVEDLGGWSQEVGKIVQVIRDIADETNLLALNAAIIAAQSGEHGKAFGVVAEEIRGLAERTSSSTQEISDLVNTVQKNVANVVQSMKKGLQRIERGELLTHNAGMVLEKVFQSFESSRSMAKQIAASTFEHKIDSSHVVRSIQRVADIARKLESSKFGKWTAAGETLATAKMMKALARGANLGEPAPHALEPGSASTGTLVAQPAGRPSPDGQLDSFMDRAEGDFQKIQASLASIRASLCSWIAAFDEVTDLIRSAVKRIPIDINGDKPLNCWEIINCDENLRGSCEAYKQGDWRCFLAGDVDRSTGGSGADRDGKNCVECPPYKNNLDAR